MTIRLTLSLGHPTSRAPTSIVSTSRRSGCTFRRASLISRLDSVTHDLYPRRHPRCFTRSVEHSIEYRLFLLSALNLFSRAHWRKPMPSDDVRFFPPTAHILKRHEPSAKCQRRHRAAPKSRTRLNLMFLVRCPAFESGRGIRAGIFDIAAPDLRLRLDSSGSGGSVYAYFGNRGARRCAGRLRVEF